jgi:hypothetical protein
MHMGMRMSFVGGGMRKTMRVLGTCSQMLRVKNKAT